MDQPDLAPLAAGDPEKVARYRLLGRLGAGGMGVVYLAEGDGQKVALKQIRADLVDDAEFRRRFRREVDAARRLTGRYTAAVLDADVDGPRPYLVTDYIAGPNLAEHVRAHGPFDRVQGLALAAGLADALAAAHAAGVVHRDVKPTNVLLSDDGPRLIDFGIAYAAESTSLTRTGSVTGSPAWMAPEQVDGRPVTAAADVFAWGATVAYATTGTSPFGDGRPDAVMYRILNQEPNLGGADPGIAELCHAALAKDPQDRPTAAQLAAWASGQTITGQPTVAFDPAATEAFITRSWSATAAAGPEPTTVQPKVTSRRPDRRRLVAAGGAAALVAIVAIGMALLSSGRNPDDDVAATTTTTTESTTTSSTTTTTAPPATLSPTEAYEKLLASPIEAGTLPAGIRSVGPTEFEYASSPEPGPGAVDFQLDDGEDDTLESFEVTVYDSEADAAGRYDGVRVNIDQYTESRITEMPDTFGSDAYCYDDDYEGSRCLGKVGYLIVDVRAAHVDREAGNTDPDANRAVAIFRMAIDHVNAVIGDAQLIATSVPPTSTGAIDRACSADLEQALRGDAEAFSSTSYDVVAAGCLGTYGAAHVAGGIDEIEGEAYLRRTAGRWQIAASRNNSESITADEVGWPADLFDRLEAAIWDY